MSAGTNKSGYLLFEDGAFFPGEALLNSVPVFGEGVFNTSHSGYQEILTDPSYHRQIMVFTASHIGNVGVNCEDNESDKVYVAGTVIRSLSFRFSNWRAERGLADFLKQNDIPVLACANTRAITLHLRDRGAMRAGLFSTDTPRDAALKMVREQPSMVGADLASEVTCASPYDIDASTLDNRWSAPLSTGEGLRVAALDFGVKRNILRELALRGCRVTVYPAGTFAEVIIDGGHNGVLLSNGPGDPAAVSYAVDTIRHLLGRLPVFGICLGHQLLSIAAGLETFKLPFGHRGSNHPVRRESDGVIEITSQNHGFAVRPQSGDGEWRVTHINLNDGTVEGLEHRELPVFSLQYHPEASPGPHDSLNYFDRFIREMRNAEE